jgi:Fe2+ transport system protein FeoA
MNAMAYHEPHMLRRTPISLTDLPANLAATITGVDGPDGTIVQRLHELGFLPGERVRVVAQGPIARDPLAVRVGDSTFALRRHEARCIHVDADAGAITPS